MGSRTITKGASACTDSARLNESSPNLISLLFPTVLFHIGAMPYSWALVILISLKSIS